MSQAEANRLRCTTHGEAPRQNQSPEYRNWAAMMRRCTNPAAKDYLRYGGRGITVCARWRKFENFLADMGRRPTSGHTVDRWPNQEGNYEPGNARWALPALQNRNKRSNRIIAFEGKVQCCADWAKEKGIPFQTLQRRLGVYGWPIKRALTEPVNTQFRKKGKQQDG